MRLEDVFAFESIGDDTFCHTPSGRLGVKPKLYELERAYADRDFIRIGKPKGERIMKDKVYLGVDIGSVSVNTVLIIHGESSSRATNGEARDRS